MPIAPTYPGVYVEEIPSGVRTISGVATSIAAFVGFFARGPMNKAVQNLSLGDFERQFGGLAAKSEASYAIQQFFLNGGTEAWVVRVVSGSFAKANVQIAASIGGAAALTVTAISEGEWGNNLRVAVDPATTAGEFNLTISEVAVVGSTTTVVQQEIFRNLSMDNTTTNFVATVINDENAGSKLVRVAASGTTVPLTNGTFSGDLSTFPTLTATTPAVNVTIGAAGPFPATFASKPATLAAARNTLEAAIRAAALATSAFAGATVTVVNSRLRVLAEPGTPTNRVVFAAAGSDTTTVTELALTGAGAVANAQAYTLGAGAAVANTAQLAGAPGADGTEPDGIALIGAENSKTGIYALEDVDLFNLLCIPRTAMVSANIALAPTTNPIQPTDAANVLSVANAYCAKRRAFLIVDTPNNIDEVQEIKDWLANLSLPFKKNAALYFPRVRIADPLNGARLRSRGASGTMAGLYARTDSTRGVWKAPAGTEAVLAGVQAFDYKLTDPENGTLNPLGIDALRNFPIYGNVAWGARTLDGSDQAASEWKYIPVRRLALYIEESLYRGTQWVVFEPNDEPLWAQIRLNVGAFMNNLFRQGAFQGTTPREAYFVKCDKETTTQNDINLGIVNILVGFAPLKPAEFVIIKLQQMAGQIET